MTREELVCELDKVQDWCAGCEQEDILSSATVDTIMALIDQWVAAVIGEDEHDGFTTPGHPDLKMNSLDEQIRNDLRAEQREKAGINKQTKKGGEV